MSEPIITDSNDFAQIIPFTNVPADDDLWIDEWCHRMDEARAVFIDAEIKRHTVLIQDAREKHNHHNNIENYCREHDIRIVRKVLNVGDYCLAYVDDTGQILLKGKISVDVKAGGLQELVSDLQRDRRQFDKKYSKCYKDGVQLFVLVEEPIKTLNDLVSWKAAYSKLTGRELLDYIHKVKVSYGVRFVFCDKKDTAETLMRILRGKYE